MLFCVPLSRYLSFSCYCCPRYVSSVLGAHFFCVWFVYIHLLLVFRFIDVLFLHLLLPFSYPLIFSSFFFHHLFLGLVCYVSFQCFKLYISFNGIVFFFFILYFSLLSIIISRNLVHDSSIPWIHRLLRLARSVCTVNWVLVLFCFSCVFFISFIFFCLALCSSVHSVCSSFPFRFLFVNIYSSSKFLNLSCHLFHLSIIFSTVRLFWYILNEMIRVSIWRWNFCCSMFSVQQYSVHFHIMNGNKAQSGRTIRFCARKQHLYCCFSSRRLSFFLFVLGFCFVPVDSEYWILNTGYRV